MNWFGWVMLIVILGGAAVVWGILNDPKHGVVGCCGCGQCAHTGECVLVKGKKVPKQEEKEEDPS